MPFSPAAFRLAACRECGSLFCTPRPSSEDLSRFYAENYNYSWFEKHRLLKAIQGWHRWQRLKPFLRRHQVRPGRILDVGCGHGLFLRWAKRSGWEAVGIDYPSAATRQAREQYGLRVIESDAIRAVQERARDLGQFDLVTVWHCLEHAAEPLSLAKYLRMLLKPSGHLIVAVPNAACPGMRLKREAWVWCQEPFVHTVHFTPQSLTRLLVSSGLSVLSTSSRDTWDANRSYDLERNRWVASAIGLACRLNPRLQFYLEEFYRLGAYAIGCFKHWALGHESASNEGSELLAIAEVPGPVSPERS